MSLVKYILASEISSAFGKPLPAGKVIHVGEWTELSYWIGGAHVLKSQCAEIKLAEVVAEIDGKVAVTDNGNWTRQGRHYRDHWTISEGKATHLGEQHFWNNVKGGFEESDHSSTVDVKFDDDGNLSICGNAIEWSYKQQSVA